MSKAWWDFRDVSDGLKVLRDLLLGRKHNLHGRFAPKMAPRTIPQPDIPRGPYYKYSDQYYLNRHALDSVKPPVVAPVAEGKTNPSMKLAADAICFVCAPTPGPPWWWDGHCYYGYEFTAPCGDTPPVPPCPPPVCPPGLVCPPPTVCPSPQPCPPPAGSCPPCEQVEPLVPQAPDKIKKH